MTFYQKKDCFCATTKPAHETRALPGISRPRPLSYQLIRRDRQIAHTFARRVENCVCYGGGDTDDSNLADSARAEIRHVWIGFVYEIDIEFRRRVGVHSDMVFGKMRINNAADIWIGNCTF